MRILALDLGTDTGYAMESYGYPLSCGTLFLASDKELKQQKKIRGDRLGDIRFFRLVHHLRRICTDFHPHWIVFEDVQFASTSKQAHLWATFRAAVWLVASEFAGVRVECCPVMTLKKFAGSGKADKAAMARYLCQNPRFRLGDGVTDTVTGLKIDDNAVDALHLLNWAKSILK